MLEKDKLRKYISQIKNTIKVIEQRVTWILLPVLNYLDDLEKMDNIIGKIFNENLTEDDEKYIKSLDQKNLEKFQKKLTEYLINIVILDEKHISEQGYKYIKFLEQKYINQIKDIVNSRLIEYKSSHSSGRRIIYLQEILDEIKENKPHSPQSQETYK